MYVSSGASVSAPSEHLGFYFGGMRADDWGSISVSGNSSELTESDKLITVDMSEMRNNKWANYTVPEYVVGRANAEAVWVPVSEQGIVVVIGGVVNPVGILGPSNPILGSSDLSKEEESESKRVSPGFMESVSVYDVAENKWYWNLRSPLWALAFCYSLDRSADYLWQVHPKHHWRYSPPAGPVLFRLRQRAGRFLAQYLYLRR